jgi:spore maturation protein CgeB
VTHIFLASPSFHGYHDAIAAAFADRGHQVTTFCYDQHSRFSAKVRHRLVHELPTQQWAQRWRQAQTEVAITALAESKADVVVVVKGDHFTEQWWEHIASRPKVIWLYDELRRTRYADISLTEVGPIASYSPLDVQEMTSKGVSATYLPLAFDHRLTTPDTTQRSIEIVFVGARYPKRERLLSTLADAKVPVKAFGRDWSKHPLDQMRTLRWRRYPFATSRGLSRADTYQKFLTATASVNIHNDQDGLTMRTFEICGVGGLQLIDRCNLTGLYDNGENMASFKDGAELIDLCKRARVDQAWANRLRARGQARTLAEHTFDHRIPVLEQLWG